MGLLATVVEFLRTTVGGAPAPEVKCDLGGGDAVTGYHFSPAGVDAPPLPGDLAYLGEDVGAGNAQAIAYQDPKNAGVAAGGELRLYARTPAGTIAAEVWLKGDGSIMLSNPLGSVELGADGSATITAGAASGTLGADGAIELSNAAGGLAIDAAGIVTATTPAGTFGAGTHTHASPFGPTGPPIPGT